MSLHGVFLAALAAALVGMSGAARADIALSSLVVELSPAHQAIADIEVWNNGDDRSYVTVEPREVLDAGTLAESSREEPDPEKLGLLVSPARLVLEPGARRLLRIANLAPATDRERVYRVTVKPVVGGLSSKNTGLKVLVGYEILVLVRPANSQPHVNSRRIGGQLVLRNDGNVSVELLNGSACDASGKECEALSGGRIYAGAEKAIDLSSDRRAHFTLKVGDKVTSAIFE